MQALMYPRLCARACEDAPVWACVCVSVRGHARASPSTAWRVTPTCVRVRASRRAGSTCPSRRRTRRPSRRATLFRRRRRRRNPKANHRPRAAESARGTWTQKKEARESEEENASREKDN
eukprot:5893099-Pleurochrysis_carterae.AAC.1